MSPEDKAAARLVSLYKRVADEIFDTIDTMTDFGRAQRLAVLRDIQGKLNQLNKETAEWLAAEIPKYYKEGTDEAIAGLRIAKAEIAVAGSFTTVNQRAIQALVDDASASFADAMTVAGRSARTIINAGVQRSIRERIAEKLVVGANRRDIVSTVRDQLRRNGITVLKDRSGRAWSMENYADMLARTKITEARNTGLQDRMIENGYDLVQVSRNGSKHKGCAVWEGKILSLTGATKGYQTVEEARNKGLFHPRCKHTANVIIPELWDQLYVYDPEKKKYVPTAKVRDSSPQGKDIRG